MFNPSTGSPSDAVCLEIPLPVSCQSVRIHDRDATRRASQSDVHVAVILDVHHPSRRWVA